MENLILKEDYKYTNPDVSINGDVIFIKSFLIKKKDDWQMNIYRAEKNFYYPIQEYILKSFKKLFNL